LASFQINSTTIYVTEICINVTTSNCYNSRRNFQTSCLRLSSWTCRCHPMAWSVPVKLSGLELVEGHALKLSSHQSLPQEPASHPIYRSATHW